MLGRAPLPLTFAAITAVVITLEASGALAAPKKTAVSETYRIDCVAGKVCKGTSGDDTIYGTNEKDNINPFSGNDTVYAGEGDDYVHHSYGNDYIEGGLGVDTLRGGFGNDTVYANQPVERRVEDNLAKEDSADVPDDGHDLVDCAYVTPREDPTIEGDDEGYGSEEDDMLASDDTVVDCSNRDDQ